MAFLAVSRAAAQHLAVDRYLQSVEFSQGQLLAKALTDLNGALQIPRITTTKSSEGLCFLSSSNDVEADAVVFDLASNNFFENWKPEEALAIFQKSLRFCLRHWAHQTLSSNERILPGSSKGIVFPFPISSKSSFRIVFDLAPDHKRQSKRQHLGNCLLAFRASFDEKGGVNEEVDVATYRKAISALNSLRASLKIAAKVPQNAPLDGVNLTEIASPPLQVDAHLGFDGWQRHLTTPQLSFINAPLLNPHRIEGPAGSGKTISLVLKAIKMLRAAESEGKEHRSLFVAHSQATKRMILNLMDANDTSNYSKRDSYASSQFLKVTTLHDLCGELLGKEISESEYLDRDALESKNTQMLYVEEALKETLENDFKSYAPFLSHTFSKYITHEDSWTLSEILRHEISVVIKGRADEDLEKYKQIPTLNTGLPIANDADRGFLFVIFQKYQERLKYAAAFDTDDVVLSALAQLNTPIWRRRRSTEGYDSVFVDETHLFNLNELSVFHFLTKSSLKFPIAYSADASQSLEDRGWTDQLFDSAFFTQEGNSEKTPINTVFRCSPEILNLASSIAANGATLFANFDKSLRHANSAFTGDDERQCKSPLYLEAVNDSELVRLAFNRAEQMAGDMQGGKAAIAVIFFDNALWTEAKHFCKENNKPVELLVQRGDMDVQRRAQRAGRFVMTMPDYVGGLEFSGVILVGVDSGRVPPESTAGHAGSAAFLSYQAFSRLYVSLTRARYRVEILGNASRSPSKLLVPLLESGILTKE